MAENKFDKKPRNKAPKKWRKAMIGVAVAAAAGTAWSVVSTSNDLASASRIPTSKNITSLAGSPKGSPRYNELVVENNKKNEAQSIVSNSSNMPTITSQDAVLDERALEEPKPAEDTVVATAAMQQDVPPADVAVQAVQAVQDQMDSSMVDAMTAYMSQWRQPASPQTVVYAANTAALEQKNKGASLLQRGAITQVSPDNSTISSSPFKVGEFLYGVNLLNVNSDSPSAPVVVEIVSGSNTKGKFIGSFVMENERLVLKFTTFSDRAGTVYNVNAYAIDPNRQSADIRSSIDHHYFKRWGGIVAASFLQGMSAALQNSGSTTIVSNGTAITTNKAFSRSEQARIAAGKVGEKVSGAMDKQFKTPATVTLKPGIPVGILIVSL